MRGRTALCAALAAMAAWAMVVPAAPLKPAAPIPVAPAASPTLHIEALQFAQTLNQLFAQIEVKYIRPVARTDLAEAAVRGLYEAVREPMPPDLSHAIRRADEYQLVAMLTRVREGLGQHEVLRGRGAMVVAMQALPRVLDPFSGLVPSRDQDPKSEEGDMTGVGLEFPLAQPQPTLRGVVLDAPPMMFDERAVPRASGPAGPIRVANVIPGGPAQRAGMRPGDLVVKVDGLSPEAPAFQTALRALQHILIGTPFQPANARDVRVTVVRDGVPAPLEFRLTQTTYHPESVFGVSRRPDGTWNYMLDRTERLGYIRLGAIGTHDSAALQAAVKSLQDQSVRGLLLDLRWCPGGFLTESATMARVFLSPDLPIATQRSRESATQPVDALGVQVTATDIPIVVLVNGETSGGGELIAAALQDHGRAIVVGQRTVGKGTVQTSLALTGYPFKLTSGTFIRPNGKNFHRHPNSKPDDDWGVRPDPEHELPLTAELSKRLKEWHTLHALRPPSDRSALPIDDPDADPQRQAAERILRELAAKKLARDK
jgi:carboxyl-terminal processing protease